MAWSVQSAVMAGSSGTVSTASSSAGNDFFGGTDLLLLLVLAFGGALVVGNVLALVRPPSRQPADGEPRPRPPLWRSLLMIGIGLVVVIWAIASITS